ncbi:MAG: glutathione S-transferase N-terminal domain-containing protein [Pseudomonadota bacterium]|nr:glutathione S-transferase N-terminal domain-containing protein [Pseudomonadota bacterium]
MTRTVYDLCGANDVRFSPYCWRTRMALAHKGLIAEFLPWRFTERERLEFSGSRTVPVLVDGSEVVSDSWRIANYLEATYAESPSLFGGDPGLSGFVNAWADAVLVPAVAKCVVSDILDRIEPVDRSYFRASREERFGMPLEALAADRQIYQQALDVVLTPLRVCLRRQPWLSGPVAAYADYSVFGVFQWARLISPDDVIAADDPVSEWREKMLDRFDGLGRKFAAAT